MDVTQSAIWEEIRQIKDEGANDVHFDYYCEFHTAAETFKPHKLTSLIVDRNYRGKLTDVITLAVEMGKGTYDSKVYPNKENLTVTVYKAPMGELSEEDSADKPILSRTYRAVPLDAKSSRLQAQGPDAADADDADRSSFDPYYFQLLDLAAEQLYMKTVGAPYRDMTPLDVVRGVMTMALADLELEETAMIKGVDVAQPDNEVVRAHVLVPHGTSLTREFPQYVQQYCGGIYKGGLGHYIQGDVWYVYPRLSLDRFGTTPRTLTVISIPPNRLPGIERTYKAVENSVVLISTGKVTQTDVSDAQQLTEGNGVRFVEAERMINDFRTVTNAGEEVTVNMADNWVEIALRERASGINQAPMSKRRITANPYHEISMLMEREGTYLEVVWENADPDLICPGMPVRYVYMDGEDFS